ncbi:MAG: hypothetical protein INR65_10805 [Gluconacetobacter diazotrophicus]|nr:hypothetical protein [Gluconacetobacter diazotrophicus]
MPARVLIIDTSVLCCLLAVPGKETCGSASERWDQARVRALLHEEQGSTLVLPIATIIETGNHIAQAASDRFEIASEFAKLLTATADGTTPWAAFTEQAALWGSEQMRTLAATWPALAAGRLSIGDATIKDVAEFYAKANYEMEIVTGDAGLKAYQPASKPLIPRRRR